MTDAQINEYLSNNNFEVDARDCIRKVLNRSYQIIETDYDINTDMMTIVTPDNTFTFKWILKKL